MRISSFQSQFCRINPINSEKIRINVVFLTNECLVAFESTHQHAFGQRLSQGHVEGLSKAA